MSIFAELIEELSRRFPGVIRQVDPAPPNQVGIRLAGSDVRPVVQHLLSQYQARFVTVFAEDRTEAEGCFYNYYVLEAPGEPSYLILRAPVSEADPRFPSLAAQLPAVNWQEREIQDWFGLTAVGHPNPRRMALHDNWPDIHPLRKDFGLRQELPPFEGEQHVYRPTLGEGVFQIPVGPVHAGIIEPGHFNFAVAGEPILYLQLRMFYTHKAAEKLFEHLPVRHAVFLAESISGDSAFSHGTAFCQAVEAAAGVTAPPRGRFLRTILLELERLYNHVADIGAICADVGFAIANAHAGRLREMLVGTNEVLTGSRTLRGMICPGGVRRNWSREQIDALLSQLRAFEREFADLVSLIHKSESTRDRLEHTGFLRPDKARALGIVGVAGRASGVDTDVRRDHPYAAYEHFRIRVPVYREGDVWRRMQVRIDEVTESTEIIRTAAGVLPNGPHCVPLTAIPAGQCALGAVEGWRGEIVHWVRTGPDGGLDRCRVKDPSLNNWPALVEAVQGNIIADFPVINKSFNLSYSGTDR